MGQDAYRTRGAFSFTAPRWQVTNQCLQTDQTLLLSPLVELNGVLPEP